MSFVGIGAALTRCEENCSTTTFRRNLHDYLLLRYLVTICEPEDDHHVPDDIAH